MIQMCRGKGRLLLCTASISIHVFPKTPQLIEGYKFLLDLTFALDFFPCNLRKVANFNSGGKQVPINQLRERPNRANCLFLVKG